MRLVALAACLLLLCGCAGAAPDPPYDPKRPLTDYARARVGNYHTGKELKFEWRSDDGTVVRRMRIPAEYVMYAKYGRVRENRDRQVATPAPKRGYDNDVRRVTLGIWLTGDPKRPMISLKRALAERPPGDDMDPLDGTRVLIDMEGRYSPKRIPSWGPNSATRGTVELAHENGRRRLMDSLAGLERYRPQTCGPQVQQQFANHPYLPDEPVREGCRDLSGPMEAFLSPADATNGISLKCDVFHPLDWHRCHSGALQHNDWDYQISFAKVWIEHWREVKSAAEEVQTRFVVSDSSDRKEQ